MNFLASQAHLQQLDSDKLTKLWLKSNQLEPMLNTLGKTQRSLLRLMLKAKEGTTIDAIVKQVQITKTAVYQHINTLEKLGYIKKFTQQKTQGRPGQRYVLSEDGIHLFPKQYSWFSGVLLQRLKQSIGDEELESMMRDMGNLVAEEFQHQVNQNNEAEKLKNISDLMNNLGYESTVSSEQEQMISACNCVYHDLAKEIPEVCSFDLALLTRLSGQEIEHQECMVRGGNCCRFCFGKPVDKSSTKI